MKCYLHQNETDWITWNKNPPATSHMGGVWERQILTARTILDDLLRTHRSNLKKKKLRTLMTGQHPTSTSRLLKVYTLNDVNSEIPLSTSNSLMMATDVILIQPGVFGRQDL